MARQSSDYTPDKKNTAAQTDIAAILKASLRSIEAKLRTKSRSGVNGAHYQDILDRIKAIFDTKD